MNKFVKYLKNPALVYPLATSRGLTNWVSDEVHLKLEYKARIGRCLDLEHPTGFNEKLQWLKLHDRNPLYTKLVDKYAVKEWVADRIGSQYVTETYARWSRVEDIDISCLPERFVLKTNHDCGGIAICRDRASFDLEGAKRKLAKHMKRNYFWGGREWPYKNVKPCIFAEEYLEDDASGDLPDYKLFHFSNGRIVTLFMTDRFTKAGLTETFFDEEWVPLELSEGGHPRRPGAAVPERFNEMKALTDRLAGEFPFARVDFYESKGRLLFGEMTFYPNSGFERFDPEEWDTELGSWLELPNGGGWLLVNNASLIWLHLADVNPSTSRGMTDYKIYCFNGEPGFLYVSQGLEDHATARISFMNLDWSFAPFCRGDYASFDMPPEVPTCLDEMIGFSRALSEGIPFVRVDFYDVAGEPRFSEMTFHPCSGFMPFSPKEWDLRIGDMLSLEGAYGPLGRRSVR